MLKQLCQIWRLLDFNELNFLNVTNHFQTFRETAVLIKCRSLSEYLKHHCVRSL